MFILDKIMFLFLLNTILRRRPWTDQSNVTFPDDPTFPEDVKFIFQALFNQVGLLRLNEY